MQSYSQAKIMKIKEIKKENRATKAFAKKEWAIADLEHYGKAINWKKKKYYLVALDDDGKIIGMLNFFIIAGVGQISRILVVKNKRRGKIGMGLMQKAEEFAKKHGAHKIFLWTGKDWSARSFYKSLGYKITGKFLNDLGHQDFVIFTKFLK